MKKMITFAWAFISAFALMAQPVFVTAVPDGNKNYTGTSNLLFYTSEAGDVLYRSNGTEAGTFSIKSGLSNATRLTAVGNLLYFIDNGGLGSELWVSNGTAAGTVSLTSFTEISSLTAFGSQLAFIAQTASGRELWKSNGTVAGTVMIKDINPGAASGLTAFSELEVSNSLLYFAANNGTQGTELWKSNGTNAGTTIVRDIIPGAGSSSPFGLTKVGTRLFFLTQNPEATLWRTDGTVAGTVAIEVLPYVVHQIEAVDIAGIMYFGAFGSFDSELWRSDGTAAGTFNIYTGFLEMIKPINVNGTLAFTINNQENWYLYRSTGLPGGHTLIDEGFFAHETAVIGKYIFYPNNDGSIFDPAPYLNELHQSDLTIPGTKMIKELYSTLDTTFALSANLTVVGNSLYFTSENNREDTNPTTNLWKLTPEDRLVSSFTLLNSITDLDIRTLSNGDTIYTDQHVNVRANTYGPTGSVKFFVNGSAYSLENVAPFALAGDNSGNYNEWAKPTGLVTIAAEPYSGSGGSGTVGTRVSVQVRIISPSDTVTTSPQINFTLVNALSDSDIGPLTNGQVIDLASLPTNKLNIRANSTLPGTESVVFDFNGVTNYRTENTAPYALFADNMGDYNQWTATPGTYTLRATPYTENFGGGTAGVARSITFTIINSAARVAYSYPNPAAEQVTVTLSDEVSTTADVVISDIQGKEYFSGKVSCNEGTLNLDLAGLDMASGVYLIKVNKGNGMEVVRMVKR